MTDQTTSQPLVLIGGGGHALVVAEAAVIAGWRVAGFLDDAHDAVILPDIPRLGGLGGTHQLPGDALAIIALGDLATRRRILQQHELPWATVIHPAAWVSPNARLARGVFVGAGAVIQGRTSIGAHAIINTGAIVEHDCVVGENCHIAPRTAIGGGVTVGAGTLIGIGACAIPTVAIGAGCTIGAGSVIVRDVQDGHTAVGVPANVLHAHGG